MASAGGRGVVVTIDGPAGSGKSTTARKVAERLGYAHLDSGAIYRTITLALIRRGIDPDNAEVYLGMAQTHAAAGNQEQAKATAERGMLYCSGSSQCDALRAYTR